MVLEQSQLERGRQGIRLCPRHSALLVPLPTRPKLPRHTQNENMAVLSLASAQHRLVRHEWTGGVRECRVDGRDCVLVSFGRFEEGGVECECYGARGEDEG